MFIRTALSENQKKGEGVFRKKMDFLKFTPENERGVQHFIAIWKA